MSQITQDAGLTLVLEHAVAGGRCLARHDGKVVLVEGGLPGEKVRVRLVREEKRHAEAVVEEVLEAHPRRRTPPCPHASECGGCDLQHAERDLQLEMKRSIVSDAFRRIAHLDVGELLEGPSETDTPEFGSRNRIRLSFDSAGRPGLLKRGTHDVVAIEDCLLMEPSFGKVFLPWIRMAPPWNKAGVRIDSDGTAILHFETADQSRDKDRRRLGKITRAMERPSSIRGLLADRVPLGGARDLRYRVAGKELRADASSFFQVNVPGTETVVARVVELLGEDRSGTLLDLYAGVGLFAVCVGSRFERVIATESDARAIRHLKHNLKKSSVRAEVHGERAEETLARPGSGNETVILDPPRIGLTKEARRALVQRAPRRIVSVSCDPATGARDAGALVQAGWSLDRLIAVDLFPVTAQVETVALLTRRADQGPETTENAGAPGSE